jgi:hypothetical protein
MIAPSFPVPCRKHAQRDPLRMPDAEPGLWNWRGLTRKLSANSPEVFMLESPPYSNPGADRLSCFVPPRIDDISVLRRFTTEVGPLPTPHILSLSFALAIWARLIQPSVRKYKTQCAGVICGSASSCHGGLAFKKRASKDRSQSCITHTATCVVDASPADV